MPAQKGESAVLAKLRRDAEARLKEGSAPETVGWSVGINALSLLHELAGKPESAVDALKLLHELQVYQIELDLQHEQIETSHRDLVEDLTHYREMFECAPAAYLNLSPEGKIFECNLAAARLLDVEYGKARGRSLEGFLVAASRTDLAKLLKRLDSDGASESCEVQIKAASGSRTLQVLARTYPGRKAFLVMLVELPERS